MGYAWIRSIWKSLPRPDEPGAAAGQDRRERKAESGNILALPRSKEREESFFFFFSVCLLKTKGPAKKKVGDPRGGWVGQSTKKD
jgi:hypothetical protein